MLGEMKEIYDSLFGRAEFRVYMRSFYMTWEDAHDRASPSMQYSQGGVIRGIDTIISKN